MIRRVLNVLQVAALVAAVLPAEERPFYDKSTLEEMVRYVMLWGPDIKVEFDRATPSPISGFKEVRVRATYQGSTQTETILVSEDGKRIIQGSVFELNQNPFRAATSRISLRNQPSKGSPDAGVDIVVFSDFQCPACRKLADEMRTNIEPAYNGKIRVFFKDLPIARRHPWAQAAAIAGRCIARQKSSSFWTYHDWAFAHQSEITEAGFRAQLLAATEPLALDKEALTACLDSRATEPEISQSIAEATEIGVPGTPTIFVNGRKLPNPSTAVLRTAIDFELQRKARGLIPDCNCGDTANPKPH